VKTSVVGAVRAIPLTIYSDIGICQPMTEGAGAEVTNASS
jgi:hypothetical protein